MGAITLKKSALLLLWIFSLATLSAQSDLKVEFRSQTRGYREIVVLENAFVHLLINSPTQNTDTTFRMAQKDWNRLRYLTGWNLIKQLPNLKTNAGASTADRAKSSTLEISRGETTATSKPFDDYAAPRKLMPVMNIVRKYAEVGALK